FISNESINILKEVKKFVFDIWFPQHFPKDNSLEDIVHFIVSQLKTDEFLDNWSDIKSGYLKIKSYYESQFKQIHQKVMKDIEEMMNEIEKLPQYHLFDLYEQRAILDPLSKYYEDDVSNSKY